GRAGAGRLARSRLQGLDVVGTRVLGDDGATELPLRDARCELGVEAMLIRVPQLDRGAAETVAVEVGYLAFEDQRGAGLVLVAHRHLAVPWELRGGLHVVRALDGTLGAGVVVGGA